jgi:hypothetical protein
MIHEVLHNWRWIGDTHGIATIDMLHEILKLWDMVSGINL